ncbi:MAG: class I SAM-dependent methyltransferase [Cyanobacteria bacterium HKST-UBA02]|nr:class I SAM-dependent methyltransferase [Cyanobacteria bacterium HKST-UBA02]
MGLTDQEYAERFQEYLLVSRAPQVTLEFLTTSLTALLPAEPPVRLLSVGAGTGSLDFAWMATFAGAGLNDFDYHLIEPNRGFFEQIEAKKAECADSLAARIHTDCSTLSEAALDGEFDFILMSHVFYYLEDRLASLEKVVSRLTPKGRIAITLYSPSGIYQIHKKFLRRFTGDDYKAFSCEDLIELVESLRLPYRCVLLRSSVDVTECLLPESASGQRVLEFFVESRLAHAESEEVRNFVRDLCYVSVGRSYLFHPVGVVIVGG